MPAKLVVTADTGGSRISLVGASGKTLLVSGIFAEPRAKGATLRALRGLLGEQFPVEDETTAAGEKARPAKGLGGDIAQVKTEARRRGRAVVKAGEAAIEHVAATVSELATGSSSPTATRRRGTAKAAETTKKTSETSAKPAKKSTTTPAKK